MSPTMIRSRSALLAESVRTILGLERAERLRVVPMPSMVGHAVAIGSAILTETSDEYLVAGAGRRDGRYGDLRRAVQAAVRGVL